MIYERTQMALIPSVIMASIAIRCLPAFNAITAKYFVPAIKITWSILIFEMNVKINPISYEIFQ